MKTNPKMYKQVLITATKFGITKQDFMRFALGIRNTMFGETTSSQGTVIYTIAKEVATQHNNKKP